MRKLLLSCLFVFMASALAPLVQAANCVTAVYYIAGARAPDDLRFIKVPFSDVSQLKDSAEVATLRIQMDNISGNPTELKAIGHEMFGLSYIPVNGTRGREGMLLAQYDRSPEVGTRDEILGSILGQVGLSSTRTTYPNGLKQFALDGMDAVFIGLNFNTLGYDDITDRAQALNIGPCI